MVDDELNQKHEHCSRKDNMFVSTPSSEKELHNQIGNQRFIQRDSERDFFLSLTSELQVAIVWSGDPENCWTLYNIY